MLTDEKTDGTGSLKPESYPLIGFPEEDWTWFETACGDLEVPCDDAKRKVIERLYSHLLGVNAWMNLTRLTAPRDYLKFHLLDSLTILNVVNELTQGESESIVLDLGSGGGYPGLPLAVWRPDLHIVLNDSRPRKVEFLKEAIKLTGNDNAEAAAFRGREVRHFRHDLAASCDIVTARAVGKAADLLVDASELLVKGGAFIIMKGRNFERDEGEDFEKACRHCRFETLEIMPVALDEDDPDRFVILAVKK